MPLLTGVDFRQLFHSFQHTAFRLEVRESYYEKEQLGQFMAGGPVDISYMDTWLAQIVKSRVAGKRVERVRIVSVPHSDYTRYGLWLCQYNTRAGEDIRYLERVQATGLPDHDYWLFDASRLYIVRFTDDDQLLGAEPIDDPGAIIQANAWRDAAWHHAIPYDQYVKMAGSATQHPASA
jgi:hypothetical protein